MTIHERLAALEQQRTVLASLRDRALAAVRRADEDVISTESQIALLRELIAEQEPA